MAHLMRREDEADKVGAGEPPGLTNWDLPPRLQLLCPPPRCQASFIIEVLLFYLNITYMEIFSPL
jgi:hypothetical protein